MFPPIDRIFSALDQECGKSLVVAYSGGLDSTLLLHIAGLYRQARSGIKLRALHVDHGNAFATGKNYSLHCRNWCSKQSITCAIEKADIAPQGGKSLEQVARTIRYSIFAEHLKSNEFLLMAHHLDDQLETLLLRLNRGAGLRGLASIPRRRALGKGQIFRPLLDIEREQIEALAKYYSLQWLEDPANADSTFDRNYLRHKIIDLLRKRWPDLARRWQGTLALLEQQNQAMDWLCQKQLIELVSATGALSIDGVLQYPLAVQSQLIVSWLQQSGVDLPGKKRMHSIMEQMHSASKIDLPQHDLRSVSVRVYRDYMYVLKEDYPPPKISYQWNPRQALKLPHGQLKTHIVASGGLAFSGGRWQISFRAFREHKDVIRLPGRKHSTSLKKLFQQLGVPPWQRPHLPLIFCNDKLIAVADMAVDQSAIAHGEGLAIKWEQ